VVGLIPGNTADESFLGFFGAGGPGNSVAVGSYQDTTHRVDSTGADDGIGVNFKWLDANNVSIDGAASAGLPVAVGSGSLVIRLSGVGSVQTQNGKFYAVQLNASSGVLLGEAPDNQTTQAAEVDQDSAFTDLSADGTNDLDVTNHSVASAIHDWHVGVSVKPLTTGVKNNWGFQFTVEYF